eukprot:jgi/Chrzof1/10735/Cz05g10150.t1
MDWWGVVQHCLVLCLVFVVGFARQRVEKVKALDAPVTQVIRVQIPTLKNLSGHTGCRGHSGLCARQFPDLPGYIKG